MTAGAKHQQERHRPIGPHSTAAGRAASFILTVKV